MISSIVAAALLFMGNIYQRAAVNKEARIPRNYGRFFQVLALVLYALAFWLVRR